MIKDLGIVVGIILGGSFSFKIYFEPLLTRVLIGIRPVRLHRHVLCHY
jgi:hypothetical protein